MLRGEQAGQATTEEFSYNIRMTTADEVLKLMMKFNGRVEFTDSPSGSYGGSRTSSRNWRGKKKMTCQWEDVEQVEYPNSATRIIHTKTSLGRFMRRGMGSQPGRVIPKDMYRALLTGGYEGSWRKRTNDIEKGMSRNPMIL